MAAVVCTLAGIAGGILAGLWWTGRLHVLSRDEWRRKYGPR